MLKQSQRGDTLIEVLFAITIFTLIVVGAMSIMNQGIAAAQRSLETTLARQQIDAQAEALRFLHSSYVERYYPGVDLGATASPAQQYQRLLNQITLSGKTSATKLTTGASCPATVSHSFVVNTRTARVHMKNLAAGSGLSGFTYVASPETHAQLKYSGTAGTTLSSSEGVWIEGVRAASSPGQAGFIDFHIRACWYSVGTSRPSVIGTIVRLYDPR